MNPKAPLMPINYNRYGFPQLAPQLNHQSYIFAIPTTNQKIQPYGLNDMGDKRKPGNSHHITIMNAVIPKPHFPPPTPPTTQFFPIYPKYRHNNKHTYHPYMNKLNGWNNISRIPMVAQQHQPIYGIMPITSSSTQLAKSLMDNKDILANGREAKSYSCFGKTALKDSLQVATSHSCDMFSQVQHLPQQKIIPLPQQSTNVVISTTATPSTSSVKPEIVETTTTQKTFLPTPVVHRPISTTPATVTTSNFITFLPLQQNEASTNQKEIFQQHRQQQHNFFTLEDAITKPPSNNQIFNDPWEAYKHAQSHQLSSMKAQSKAQSTVKTTRHSFLQNFFDENYDTMEETQQIDDYTNLDKGYNEQDPYYTHINVYETPIRNRIIDENKRTQKGNIIYEEPRQYKQSINNNQYQYFSTSYPPKYNGVSRSRTTTLSPNSVAFTTTKAYPTIKYTTRQSTVDVTTTTRFAEENDQLDATTSTISNSDTSILPTYTTMATSTTTKESIFKKTNLKRPYFHVRNTTHKYPKSIRSPLKAYKNITLSTTSTTAISPLPATKKTPKYRRQYKSKKTKLLKYSLTSSTSTTTSTTTQTPPTSTTDIVTEETSTSHRRTLPIVSSTESTRKTHRSNHQPRIQKTPARNSKRTQELTTEKTSEVSANRSRGKNKHRRRNQTPDVKSKASSSERSLSKPTSISNSQTSTTSRSRSHHYEARTKPSKVPTTNVLPRENYIDNGLSSAKDGNVPPLPIEIYFKKSQHAKI
ncbi:uncharacterized protein isoform X2 [Musca autumnalis]